MYIQTKTENRYFGIKKPIQNSSFSVRPETEWQTAIRQTVPTKAPVEDETSTLINKRLCIYLKNFILN